MTTITINGHKFSTWLSDTDIQEAHEIADLIAEGNYPMAQENFAVCTKDLDAMQTIAFRDAIKHFS